MVVVLLLHQQQQPLMQLLQQHQQLEQELGEELGEGLQLQLLGVVLLEVLVEVLHQVLGEVLGEGEVHSLPQGNLVPPHLLRGEVLVVEIVDGGATSMQVVTRYFMCVFLHPIIQCDLALVV